MSQDKLAGASKIFTEYIESHGYSLIKKVKLKDPVAMKLYSMRLLVYGSK